jgi:hypothetical protein
MNPFLADALFVSGGSGGGMVHQLLVVLIVGIAIAVVWWGGTYFIGLLKAPPVALMIWNGLFVLLAIIFVVNFLMSLVGHGFLQL